MTPNTLGHALRCALISLASTTAVFAQTDDTWTNGSGDNLWENPANWASGALPTTDTVAFINRSGDDRAVVTGITAYAFKFNVGDGSGVVGTLEMTSGEINAQGGPSHHPMRIGSAGGTGHYIQHDGIGNFGGNRFQVGYSAGSVGTVDLYGGSFFAYRGYAGNALNIGEGGNGTFNVYGGILQTRTGLLLGSGPGTGHFVVHGSGATEIGVGAFGSGAGAWTQAANSTLKLLFDESGITPIHVDNAGGTETDVGAITFANGALLDVGFIGDEQFGTWVAMTWDDGVVVTDNGLGFKPGTAAYQWSFELDLVNRELRIIREDNPPPSNNVPVAMDDATAVGPGRSALIDVLNNDSDADLETITIVSVENPANGTATIEDGQIRYAAHADFNGTDTFSYTISDGMDIATAEVSVVARKFNHPGLWHTQADLDRMKAMIAPKRIPGMPPFC